jgi:hypothetical protein
MAAGFISEWWTASNRNGGRLHVGKPGRNKSESATFGEEPFAGYDTQLENWAARRADIQQRLKAMQQPKADAPAAAPASGGFRVIKAHP